jgi:predicted dehydrogenase
MSDTPLRWGILSTAEIARKNWLAIWNTGNSVVTAVASRKLERSRQFIRECQARAPFAQEPVAFGSYEELVASPQVEALYIPLPTGLRKEWVLRAAAAGKHVVCEKPCAGNLEELEAMVEACRRHQVQFMDGVMFMHSQRLDALRAVLDDGQSVGALKRMMMGFSFCASPEFFTSNIRAQSTLEPFGCLGDLGWYCIRLALWVMQWRAPRRVTGRLLSEARHAESGAPVPTEFSGELIFDGGVSAGFYCSFVTADQQWAHFSGAKGTVHVADFVLPFFGNEVSFEVGNSFFAVTGCDFNMEARRRSVVTREYSNSHPSSQETNLFRNFAAQARSGKRRDEWPMQALLTQQVMEQCLAAARKPVEMVN